VQCDELVSALIGRNLMLSVHFAAGVDIVIFRLLLKPKGRHQEKLTNSLRLIKSIQRRKIAAIGVPLQIELLWQVFARDHHIKPLLEPPQLVSINGFH